METLTLGNAANYTAFLKINSVEPPIKASFCDLGKYTYLAWFNSVFRKVYLTPNSGCVTAINIL